MNVVDKLFGINSRFTPQSGNWYEDLPPKAEAALLEPNTDGVHNDINGMDEDVLEMSRAESSPRGTGVFGGIGIGIMVAWILFLIVYTASTLWNEAIWLWFLFVFSLLLVIPVSIWFFRTDLSHPTDQPIRFNRTTRKVYVYSMKDYYNPFGKWLPDIKTYNWDTLEAQITKTRVATVRSVGARYNLQMVQVSPDNPNEIVERSFALEPNNPLGNNFDDKWSFVCNFMERGTAHLPPVVLRSKEVEFWRTVFDSTPFIAPGEYGRTSRRELLNLEFNSIKNIVFTLAMLFLVFFSVIAAPFILTLGLCAYIALKLGPAPQWPDDIAGPRAA